MKTGTTLKKIAEYAEQGTAWRITNEFQTPLGVIISAGELLESYFDRLTPERRQLALEDILNAARQMNNAMGQLTASENVSRKNSKCAASNHRTTRQGNHSRP